MFAAAPVAAAEASRGLVVVLSPENEDDVTRNAMARIRGELAAAPFAMATRALDPAIDVMLQVETVGQDLSPVAAFAIVREAGGSPSSVAVWTSNRNTRTTSVHRVAIRAGDVDRAAAELAIEAVEVVRASLAGLWPAPAVDEKPPVDDAAHLALGIGVGVIAALENAPSFFTPTLAVSVARRDRIGVRLWMMGLGPGADVSATDGTGARLQRAALSAGLFRLFRGGAIVQPMLSVGAGVQYLHVRGSGVAVERQRDLDAWSAMVSAGGGLAIALGAHVALTAEIEALVTLPKTVVRIDATDVASFEQPSLFAHGGVLARF